MDLDRAGADAPESRSAAEFEVAFVDQVGSAVQESLASCWSQPFECFRPVRSFSSHQGKRSFSGLWWFSRTGHHVGYESWLERDQLMALDADVEVVAVASQPFWLSWSAGQRRVRHAPDFFVRFSDGSAAVVDVRSDDRIEPQDTAKFAASAQACASVGWEYRRVGGLPPLLAANLRWLSGYRHPRCHDPVLAAALLATFAGGSPLMAGAVGTGESIAVLPVLFHLLWRGRLPADLTAPLGADTEVRTADVRGERVPAGSASSRCRDPLPRRAAHRGHGQRCHDRLGGCHRRSVFDPVFAAQWEYRAILLVGAVRALASP